MGFFKISKAIKGILQKGLHILHILISGTVLNLSPTLHMLKPLKSLLIHNSFLNNLPQPSMIPAHQKIHQLVK